MAYSVSDQRFVIAVGETSKWVGEHPSVIVLESLESVVLGKTTDGTVGDLQSIDDVIVHVFEEETEARTAFGLYRH